ncbi:hypothetical protein BH11ACT1_BH11ACT1_22260 [soil metagenome]
MGILLPASWWTIDLRDEQSRRRSVARLVDQQIGRVDDRAALRADARRQLGAAADQAAAAGGRMMAVSLMEAQGIPVTATLTTYRIPGGDVTGAGVIELESIMRKDAVTDDGSSLDLAEGHQGPVLRRVSRGAGPVELGAERIPMLRVDYWLDPDDGHGLMLLTFSTPLIGLREAFLDLFDTIVASVGPAEG